MSVDSVFHALIILVVALLGWVYTQVRETRAMYERNRDRQNQGISSLGNRLTRTEANVTAYSQETGRRFDAIDKRLEGIYKKLDELMREILKN